MAESTSETSNGRGMERSTRSDRSKAKSKSRRRPSGNSQRSEPGYGENRFPLSSKNRSGYLGVDIAPKLVRNEGLPFHSGAELVPNRWGDPVTPGRAQVYYMPWGQLNWAGIDPTVLTYSDDTLPLIGYADNMYRRLWAIAVRKNMAVQNDWNITASNFYQYVNHYLRIYSELRLYQAIMACGSINHACQNIAANIIAFAPTIDGYLTQLLTLPFPQSVLDLSDLMTGVYWSGRSVTDPVVMSGSWSTPSVMSPTWTFPLTDSTAFGAELTQIKIQMDTMGVTVPADFNKIANVFGKLFTHRSTPLPREVNTDLECYMQQFTVAFESLKWTLEVPDVQHCNPYFIYESEPQPSSSTLYVWDDSGLPKSSLWGSFCRPQPFIEATQLYLSSVNPNTSNKPFGIWCQNVVQAIETPLGSPLIVVYTDSEPTGTYLSDMVGDPTVNAMTRGQDYLWMPITEARVDTGMRARKPGSPGYTAYHPSEAVLIDNTIRELERIWIDEGIS